MTSEDAAGAATQDSAASPSAGAMLRAAREKQGLHIAALAAAIKVAPAKLDALECDRHDELPDATFIRALAQSVCRVLKIEAKPVLDKLPMPAGVGLERVDAGLNTPFRDRPAGVEPGEWTFWQQPAFWIVLALLAAAAAFWLLPVRGFSLPGFGSDKTAAGVAPAVTGPAQRGETPPAATPAAALGAAATPTSPAPPPAVAVVETVHSAPAPDPSASEVSTSMLTMRTDEASWVEVQDARNLVLFSRTLQPGETVGLDGSLPLKVKVGNAAATRMMFRGRAVDLQATARDNVARVELK